MNREQQIAQVITDLRDYVPTSMTDEAVDFAARQIVATLLPQVTTVAELEALSKGSVLLDGEWGVSYELTSRGWMSPGDDKSETLDGYDFPLTVVWQPEVTA